MLVLSRKAGEKIRIGEDIVVVVVRIGPNAIRMGIEAPRSIGIVREDVADHESDDTTGGPERMNCGT